MNFANILQNIKYLRLQRFNLVKFGRLFSANILQKRSKFCIIVAKKMPYI